MSETRRGFLGMLSAAVAGLFAPFTKSKADDATVYRMYQYIPQSGAWHVLPLELPPDGAEEFIDFSQLNPGRRRATVTLDGRPIICFQASPKHGFAVVPSCGHLLDAKPEPAELDLINGSRLEKRRVVFGRVEVIWPTDQDDPNEFLSATYPLGNGEIAIAWKRTWRWLVEEAPEFNREVLVQFENGSTMAAKLVAAEVQNTLRHTPGVIEWIPGGTGIVDGSSKWEYTFETLDCAQIMNRVKLWAYFKGESLRIKSGEYYHCDSPLIPVARDIGEITTIDKLASL